MLITLGLVSLITTVLLTCYIALQRGMVFSVNWSENRVAQVRVLDSMAVDLMNASNIVVGSGTTLLTLTVPARYSQYETTGYTAGEPLLSGTNPLRLPTVNTSTGKVNTAGENLTVVYSLASNIISRTATRSAIGLNTTRTVGIFGNTVTVRFLDSDGAVLNGTVIKDTIVPQVITQVNSSMSALPGISGTLSDTIFLRDKTYQ